MAPVKVYIMGESKVDSMGVTRIPNSIRKMFRIKQGDELEWSIEEGKIVVRKKLLIKRDIVESRFEELRKNTPECFTEKESEEEDEWILKELALRKSGS